MLSTQCNTLVLSSLALGSALNLEASAGGDPF